MKKNVLEEQKQLVKEYKAVNNAFRKCLQELEKTNDPKRREELSLRLKELKEKQDFYDKKSVEMLERIESEPATPKDIFQEVEQDAIKMLKHKPVRGVALNVLEYIQHHKQDE